MKRPKWKQVREILSYGIAVICNSMDYELYRKYEHRLYDGSAMSFRQLARFVTWYLDRDAGLLAKCRAEYERRTERLPDFYSQPLGRVSRVSPALSVPYNGQSITQEEALKPVVIDDIGPLPPESIEYLRRRYEKT